MQKYIIYGAANAGAFLLNSVTQYWGGEVLFFIDSDPLKCGTLFHGIRVIAPREVLFHDYDLILIASRTYKDDMLNTLRENLGVPENKIVSDLFQPEEECLSIRRDWLEQMASHFRCQNISGSIAECGVYRGEFAAYLNAHFPERRLYLFDTFEGYDSRDVDFEKIKDKNEHSVSYGGCATSIERVLSIMPHPDVLEIRQGYVPDTFEGCDDTFAFVNIDFNLYLPTKAALRFFWPRMAAGGIILCHDYFSTVCRDTQGRKHPFISCPGIAKACNEFATEGGLRFVPFADRLSVMFLKL